jgi:solute carrier family 50 protein (sugar transporter)
MARLARCPTSALLALIVVTQVQATEVSIRGHVGAGLAGTLEDVKSKSVLELFQQWGFTLPAVSRDVSFAVVNSTDKMPQSRNFISGAVDTKKSMSDKGKQPEIVRHWGFSHEHPFWGSPVLTAILHYLSFAVLIKAACMASNVLFQVSPLPLVKQFKEKQDTGEADAAPFVAIAFGGCQWCFYGVFAYLVTGKTGFLVLVYSNCLGGLLGIYYVMIFQANCSRLGQISGLSMYYRIVSALVLLQIGAMAVLPRERALFFSGLISSICSVATSLSALITLPTVIRTKCAASIPLPLCIASGVSNCLWITCGVILWDPWITFPNIIGVGGSSVCVLLCFYYGNGEKTDPESEPLAGSGSLHSTPSLRGTSPGLSSQHNGGFSADEDGGPNNEYEVHENYGTCGETGGTF